MKIALVLILFIVGFGMIPTVVPWMATPADRVFNGIHGYSSDYIQYVSYIKEGMYGRYSMLFRSFPFPQPATPIHFLYIAIGIIANIVSIRSAPFGPAYVWRVICFRLFSLLSSPVFQTHRSSARHVFRIRLFAVFLNQYCRRDMGNHPPEILKFLY